MSDLIRKQDAIDALKLANTPYLSWTTSEQHKAYVDAIENIPSVDAVEVVRCEYCMNRWDDYYCPEIERDVDRDFFCEEGIRKTDG